MTDNTYTAEDLNNYLTAKAIGTNEKYMKSKEGEPFRKSALEQLVKNIDLPKEKIKFLVEGTMASHQGILTALGIANQTYQEILGSFTVSDLLNNYSDTFDSYAGDHAEKLKEKLTPFNNDKYGDIIKKISEASYTMEGFEKGFKSEDEAKSAEETMIKYQEVISVLETIQKKSLRKAMADIEDNVYMKSFEGMANASAGDA